MTKLAIKLFGYDNAQSITTRIIGGQSWYMAVCICNLLGISNHSVAVHNQRIRDQYTLEANEYRYEVIYTGAAKRRVLMVNNNGMGKLIFQANPQCAGEIQARAGDAFQAMT
jgi:prophage antirepressor-like protein